MPDSLDQPVERHLVRVTENKVGDAGLAVTPGVFRAAQEFEQRPKTPAPAAAPSLHWALVNVKSEANEKHAIEGETVMVGRDRTCSIVLTHPAVSRRHARITLAGASCMVEDLKSANGTYVNNTRIERAKLKAGDVVRFGADPACSYVLRTSG